MYFKSSAEISVVHKNCTPGSKSFHHSSQNLTPKNMQSNNKLLNQNLSPSKVSFIKNCTPGWALGTYPKFNTSQSHCIT